MGMIDSIWTQKKMKSRPRKQAGNSFECLGGIMMKTRKARKSQSTVKPVRKKNLRKRSRRQRTSILRRMSLILMVTRNLKNRAWIGTTWNEKQRQMTAGGREMEMMMVTDGPREELIPGAIPGPGPGGGNVVVRRTIRDDFSEKNRSRKVLIRPWAPMQQKAHLAGGRSLFWAAPEEFRFLTDRNQRYINFTIYLLPP